MLHTHSCTHTVSSPQSDLMASVHRRLLIALHFDITRLQMTSDDRNLGDSVSLSDRSLALGLLHDLLCALTCVSFSDLSPILVSQPMRNHPFSTSRSRARLLGPRSNQRLIHIERRRRTNPAFGVSYGLNMATCWMISPLSLRAQTLSLARRLPHHRSHSLLLQLVSILAERPTLLHVPGRGTKDMGRSPRRRNSLATILLD